MPGLFSYRLFISHAWRYGERYRRVIDFLDAANNFSYTNYSVPADRAFDRMNVSQLKEELRQQIRPTQVVVIVGGMYIAHSDWIQFEIDFSKSLGKPILGIRPRGAQVMPRAVSEAADEIVNWNTASMVGAIRRLRR